MKQKILILGASGFTGHNLYDFLSTKDNFLIDKPSHKELDVLDQGKIKEYLNRKKYDVLINCIDIKGMPSNYMELRLRIFANLAKYNDLYGKMIYFGSGAEYGDCTFNVCEEDFGRSIPKDMYGLCLYYMSLMAEQSKNIYNFRLFGIFGKYEDWKRRFISNAICKAVYGYPITIRQDRKMSYLDTDDLCKMVEWAIYSDMKHHCYNAVTDDVYALKDLAKKVCKITKRNVPIYIAKDKMAKEYSASSKRLQNEMNISFKKMDKSIEDLYKWYKTNKDKIEKYDLLYQ